jgi:hypothetical protein
VMAIEGLPGHILVAFKIFVMLFLCLIVFPDNYYYVFILFGVHYVAYINNNAIFKIFNKIRTKLVITTYSYRRPQRAGKYIIK